MLQNAGKTFGQDSTRQTAQDCLIPAGGVVPEGEKIILITLLTSLAELLRLKLLLLLPDRLGAPEPLPAAPPKPPAVTEEAPESVERRGMGASALKKRLSTNTVWIQALVL
jgi:hypothetical protein